MDKESFGIFAPIMGEKRDFPVILIQNVFTEGENCLLKDGKIIRRKMREGDLIKGELHTQANAASDPNGNEANDTTGWTTPSCTLTSVTIDPQTGTYHLKAVADDGCYNRIYYSFTAIVGQRYYVSLWAKRGAQGTTQRIWRWTGVETSPDEEIAEGDWAKYTYTVTASDTTIVVRIDAAVTGAAGDEVYVDNVSILGIDSTQTPDGNPIIHYHRIVKRATGIEYLLAFTKAHIYHWNPDTKAFDLKFTCSADCENWETVNYNDKVIATNFLDMVLVWTTAGNFVALDDVDNGIEYSRSYSNETNVDETSAKDQKVLKVASTTGYSADDKIIIDRNTKYREEVGVVDSVQAGVSLTLKENLIYDHTADALTEVDADSAVDQKVLNVASTDGFEEMEIVIINKGGDREEKRRIDSIQAGVSLTMTVNLSFTHTQAQGDEVLGSGSQNDKVEEYVSYYLTKAKHLTTYENYLILGYTYENGNYYPQRMRWNAIGEEENWVTGTSGSAEIGKSDVITGFGEYQGLLIVFKKYSYAKYWLVANVVAGVPQVFNGSFISTKIGCLCNGSIVNDNKGRLYWYASDKTFKEFSVGTISGPIQTDIVDKIYQTSVEKIRSDFIDETGEVVWSIPFENALNNKLITFKEGIWLQANLAIPAFGSYHEP